MVLCCVVVGTFLDVCIWRCCCCLLGCDRCAGPHGLLQACGAGCTEPGWGCCSSPSLQFKHGSHLSELKISHFMLHLCFVTGVPVTVVLRIPSFELGNRTILLSVQLFLRSKCYIVISIYSFIYVPTTNPDW